jgi:beta-lactamase class A
MIHSFRLAAWPTGYPATRQSAQGLDKLIYSIMRFRILLLVLAATVCQAQKQDITLTNKLNALIKGFNADVGIYVRHLKTGKVVEINADTLFPTASMIKVPITIGMFNKIEKGELAYDTILTYKDSLLYAGEDILGSFKQGEKISLSKVLMLMITTSDNTASLWCQSLAGGGAEINAWLDQNGFKKIRVNSRTPGREAIRTKYGWGHTSPREMAELLVRLREGKVISPRVSERIYRNLGRIYWDGEALSQVPPYVHTASKSGAVDRSKSEVVLVNAPHGDYVFCVITKNQQDQSWQRNNEGYRLIRNVSRLLWDYFEPYSKWKPADKVEEWWY